jgi:hypothetical protein
MSNPRWIRKHLTLKPEVETIFQDLEKYQIFCVKYGRKFDESDLYNNKNRNYQDFINKQAGKTVRNYWLEDQKRFEQAQQKF